MYNVYADENLIYTDAYTMRDLILIDPKLTLEDTSAGSFEFTMPLTHKYYDSLERMKTIITITKEGDEIWEGRILEETTDFNKNKKFYCEGALAFLNDTIQPPAEYHNQTVIGFLTTLLDIHNSVSDSSHQFTVGIVTVTDSNNSLYRYTNYETTMEAISDKLVSRLGGHIRLRKTNGVRYLDYLSDYPRTSKQIINFGKNLLDFTKYYNMSDYATVVLPLGAMLDESDIEGLYAYLTVKSVNDGSIYVQNEDAVAERGWICKVINYSDVTEASNLLTKATSYLTDLQYDNMELEVSAVDLHYLDVNTDDIQLLDEIQVISIPHGLNRYFPVTKIVIPLDDISGIEYTMGTNVTTSLTSSTYSSVQSVNNTINNLPTKQTILDEAKNNATQLITNATNGYVTIITNDNGTQELLISNNIDYTQATKIWRFNINGLGYSNTGYEGSYGLAITMDGSIVADKITTGILTGGNSWWNLETGEMYLVSVNELENIVNASLASITYAYAYGTSTTTAPSDSDFTYTSMPATADGYYIWRMTTFTYNDSTTTKKYEIIQGLDGEDGADIVKLEVLHYLTQNVPTTVGYISDSRVTQADTTVGTVTVDGETMDTTVGWLAGLDPIDYISAPTSVVTLYDDTIDTWTLAVPTYIYGGVYAICYQMTDSNGDVTWSTPIIDRDANATYQSLYTQGETIATLSSKEQSDFTILSNQISSVVSRTKTIENAYLSEDDMSVVIENYSIVTESELSQTAENITATFTEYTEGNYVRQDDSDYVALTTNIVFDADGVNISSSAVETNLQLAADGVYIRDSSDNDIATMTSTQFTTGDWVLQQSDLIFNIFKNHD